MTLPEIVQGEDLTKSSRPRKGGHPWGGLDPLHTLPRKASTYSTSQGVKKSLDLENAFFEMDPPKLVFTASSDYTWMQHLEKKKQNIHLLIMRFSSKAHVPLVGTTQEL